MSEYRRDGDPRPRGGRNAAQQQNGGRRTADVGQTSEGACTARTAASGRTGYTADRANRPNRANSPKNARNAPTGQFDYGMSDTATRTRNISAPTATRLMETPPARSANGTRTATVDLDPTVARTRQMNGRPVGQNAQGKNRSGTAKKRPRTASAPKSSRARKRSEQEKKQARRTVRARLFTFAVMTALLFLLSLGALTLSVRGSSVVNPKITYQLGTKNDLQSQQSIRRSQLYRDGQLYVNFSAMSSYCNFTVAGDATEKRFIFNRSGSSEKQYVSFVLGSCVAGVNGQPVRMEAPSVEENGEVLIPAAFITTYLRGITVSIDEKTGAVTVAREQDTDTEQVVTVRDPKKTIQYVDITCTLNTPAPCTRIAEADVPETVSEPVTIINDGQTAG